MNWDIQAEEKFNKMVERIPIFMREMAKNMVEEKAVNIAREANHEHITEKDMVDAFFAETPFGFHGPMKSDMELIGIDYKKYGHS